MGEAAPSEKPNYFIRHWRGDLPLVVSYWINGFFGNGILLAVFFLLAAFGEVFEGNYTAALYWILAYVCATLVVIWQAVGVWRSSDRHIEETGRRGWAYAAKVMIVLGIARFGVDFATTGLPAIAEGIDLANWLNRHATWEIHVLNDGTEVELAGGVGVGLYDDLERVLSERPGIQVLHVNLGNGGLVREATRVHALIRERNLTTFVSTTCVSACTIIYLAGKRRYLKEGAKLGFHAYKAVGVPEGELELSDDMALYVEAGVNRWFMRRIFETPHDDMWYPSEKELIDASVVTAVVSGDEFAISGIGPDIARDKLEAELQTTAIFNVLRVREPEVYEVILSEFAAGVRAGRPLAEVRFGMHRHLLPLRDKYLPYASDEVMEAFGAMVIEQAKLLAARSGELCYAYLMTPDPEVLREALAMFPMAMRQSEQQVLADIIESADLSRALPEPEAVSALVGKVVEAAGTALGADAAVLTRLAAPDVDRVLGCKAMIEFYAAVMDLEPAESSVLLRFMMSSL